MVQVSDTEGQHKPSVRRVRAQSQRAPSCAGCDDRDRNLARKRKDASRHAEGATTLPSWPILTVVAVAGAVVSATAATTSSPNAPVRGSSG